MRGPAHLLSDAQSAARPQNPPLSGGHAQPQSQVSLSVFLFGSRVYFLLLYYIFCFVIYIFFVMLYICIVEYPLKPLGTIL